MAMSATSSLNLSPLATKSVSQLTSISTPSLQRHEPSQTRLTHRLLQRWRRGREDAVGRLHSCIYARPPTWQTQIGSVNALQPPSHSSRALSNIAINYSEHLAPAWM